MVAEIKSLEIKENRIRTYDKIKIKVDLQSTALNHSAISPIVIKSSFLLKFFDVFFSSHFSFPATIIRGLVKTLYYLYINCLF